MRISDWSSDVCSSDLARGRPDPARGDLQPVRRRRRAHGAVGAHEDNHPYARLARELTRGREHQHMATFDQELTGRYAAAGADHADLDARRIARAVFVRDTIRTRSEEHTSELQSLMRISYAVFCLKKKK